MQWQIYKKSWEPVHCLDFFLAFPKILNDFVIRDPNHIQCKPIIFWTLCRQYMPAQMNKYLHYNFRYLVELNTQKKMSVLIQGILSQNVGTI